MRTRELLESVPFFGGLEDEHLDALAGIATVKPYAKSEAIFHEGDEAKGLYAVANGLVRIYKTSLSGKEQILHVFGPGEVFAEVALFKGRTYPANAQALEQSEILFLPKRAFTDLVRAEPDLALAMLGVMSMRLRGFVAKIEDLSLKEVPARLAQHLLLLQASQDRDTVRLDLPKGQLASYLGTIPETLSRIFKKLSESGVLEIDGQTLRILDTSALEAVAMGEKP